MRFWRIVGVVVGAVLLVVALFLAAPFLAVHIPWARDLALHRLGRTLDPSGRTSIRIDEVERLSPSDADLRGVSLESVRGSERVEWLRAQRVQASWQPWELRGRRIHLLSLELDSLTVDAGGLPRS